MKQKLALITITIAITICIVQGLPRTHRFKPLVNLKQEKLNVTEKPVEARKSALFPKNTKKYVVTEKPISSTTSSYSYKYYIAKRPLMLKFAPTSKPFLRRDQPRTYPSLMKKIEFVVSTPAPSHSIIKENNLKKHMKINKTNENPDVQNEINPVHSSFNMTTTEKTSSLEDRDLSDVTPKTNITTKVILIPINLGDLKSNPNIIAEEVKDIVSYMDKVHPHEGKVMAVETSSPQIDDNVTTESFFTKPATRESTGSPQTKSTTEETPSNFESDNSLKPRDNSFPSSNDQNSQNPNDDIGDILYRFPNYGFPTAKKASTGNSTSKNEVGTTPPNFVKDLTTESSSLKPADNVITENISQKSTNDETTEYYSTKLEDIVTPENALPEIIIIPVNMNEFKSHPSEVANEVKDILNEMNSLRPYQNDVTTENSSPRLGNEMTTESYPAKPLEEIPTEILVAKPNKVITTETSSLKPAIDLITESITQQSANEKTTEYYSTKLEDIVTTEKALPELIIIPVNMNEFKSHPNEVANEVKDILNEMNSLHPHQNDITTENSTKNLANEITTESSLPKPLEKVPTEILVAKPNKEITWESSSPKPAIDLITESITQKSPNEKITEYYSTKLEDIVTTEKALPELIIIPVNMNEFKSHPNEVANEVKDIFNEINKHHPYGNKVTSESSSPKLANEINTYSLQSKPIHKVTTESPAEDITTENFSKVTNDSSMTTELLLPEVVFIPVSVDKFKSHPNEVTDEVKDIETILINESIDKNNVSTEISSSQDSSQHTTKSFSLNPVNSVTTERSSLHSVDEMTTENFSSTPAYDVSTQSPSPKPENIVNPENFSTKLVSKESTQRPLQLTTNEATTESSSSKLDITTKSHTPKVEDELTMENASSETLYIPVNLDDVKSNPVIANEVRDIINYMNKLHSHRDHMTTEPSSPNTEPIETNETDSPKHTKDVIIENTTPNNVIITNNKTKHEDNVVTEKDSPKLQDNVTTESSSPEVIFIPVDMSELKSNPDLIANDIKHILKNMNNEFDKDPHKNSSSKLGNSISTEQYSLKPENSENSNFSKSEDNMKNQNTSRNPYENETTEKTEKPEYVKHKQNEDLTLSNNSSEPSIVFAPIGGTTLKDIDGDDDDDINVGYIINRRNFWNTIYPTQKENKNNENILSEDKTPKHSDNNTKKNSINDDISDVVYVLHQDKGK